MRLRGALVAAILAASSLASDVGAHPAVGHLEPAGPAAAHFPSGFTAPRDAEWGWKVGGFGGPRSQRSGRWPVVFVHGNNTDHATWYTVAAQLTEELGWRAGDLWALAYNGVGCTNDGAVGTLPRSYRGWTVSEDRAASTGCVVTGNQQNLPDLKSFIERVLRYTRTSRVHIVAHSLGVTVARRTLWEHPQLYQRVAGFVAIAGGSHGTSFCPPGSEGSVESCDEIAAGTRWLAELNDRPKGKRSRGVGSNEAPRPTRWMTVFDGSGAADPAFAGTYAGSPRQRGATNCAYPGFYHNDLRVAPRIVVDYASFLLAVERGRAFRCPPPPPPP